MSRSMLVDPAQGARAGRAVVRLPQHAGRGSRYVLTDAGRDLAGVIERAGRVGRTLGRGRPERNDPGFALWAWCLVQLDRAELPDGRVLVAFDFEDQPPGNRYYWLLVEHGDAQVCYTDPGDEPAVHVRAESARRWSTGTAAALSWTAALRTRRIAVTGDRAIAAALPAMEPARATADRLVGAADQAPAERVEPRRLAREREEQQVGHLEGVPAAVPRPKSGSRRIEKRLPSIARWNVSATIRPPTPRILPLPVSASRRM